MAYDKKDLLSDKNALDALENVSFEQNRDNRGSFLVSDNDVVTSTSLSNDLEILPIDIALEKYDWLGEKLFSLVNRNKDEYVAQVARSKKKLGYFILVKQGAKIELPIQTCYLINSSGFTQKTHNIVICQKDSELHLISGCTANAHISNGTHMGVTEYFLDEGALLTTTMIHSWGKEVEVYPRSSAYVGKSAKFISNYIALSDVKKIQMNPVAYLQEKALAEFYSVVYAPKGSNLDLGSEAYLEGKGAVSNILSRSVSNGGKITARGKITGNVAGAKGYMSCNGLLLDKKGSIHAVPELEANDPCLDLSHEASVGMISEETLSYLMASGISREDARQLVIEGFLDLKVPGLSKQLQKRIDEMIEKCRDSSSI